MNRLVLPLAFLVASVPAYPEYHSLHGDAGYVLQLQRVNEGSEGQLPGRSDGESVPEFDRWLTGQSAFIGIDYRYSHFIGVQARVVSSLQGEGAVTLMPTLQQLSLMIAPLDWASITMGRQNLKWGTARTYNAIDALEVVAEPFAASFTDDVIRRGFSGMKLLLIPNEWLSFSLLGIPAEEIRWSRLACRLDLLLWDTDIGIGASNYAYTNLKGITAGSVPVTEKQDRVAVFFDCARYFGNLGFYGEAQWRYSRQNRYGFKGTTDYSINTEDYADAHVLRVTGGVHYQMAAPPFLDLSLEYFYNSEGYDTEEARDFHSKYEYHASNYDLRLYPMVLPPNFGTFGSFRRHYGYAGVSVEILSDVRIGLRAHMNIETLAYMIQPSVSMVFHNAVSATLAYSGSYQFLDRQERPSELSFSVSDHVVTFSIGAAF